MTGRSRIVTVLLAVLLLVAALAVSGCAGRSTGLSRLDNGAYKVTEGDNVWVWEKSGISERLMLNDVLYAVIQRSHAQFTLTGGQKLDVALDNSGIPATIKMSWGTTVNQDDYAQMNKALSVRERVLQEAGGAQAGSLGWVVLMLIVVIAGVLLFLYAGRLVNSWKLGGIFSGHDTAKSLLLFKAIGAVLAVIGLLILLAIIF